MHGPGSRVYLLRKQCCVNLWLSLPLRASPPPAETITSPPPPFLPLPIRTNSSTVGTLPSSDIDKNGLVPIDVVLQRNSTLRKESSAGKLACRIAREAVFVPNIMKRCTPFGTKLYPGLPQKELLQIERTIFNLFPQYWGSQVEFEGLWKSCVEAIQQSCKRLRLGRN